MLDKRTPPSSVLIVNQDPHILILLASILERNGFRVLFARSADEAVEITARQFVPIDMVVCDVSVAGISGVEITRRLREFRPCIKELFLATGEDSGAIRVRAVRHTDEGSFAPMGDLNLVDQVRRSLSPALRAGA